MPRSDIRKNMFRTREHEEHVKSGPSPRQAEPQTELEKM